VKLNPFGLTPRYLKKMKRQCKICKKPIVGRSDKVFCSIDCKNQYSIKLAGVTRAATKKIDGILHRNRSILLEILGKNLHQKKINRLILDQKNFKYDYITGYHVNINGKTVHHVYDFSWLIFSDDEVLITRKR
jgi:hypothetical protein